MTDIAQGIDETYAIRQVDDAPHREEQDRIDWLERAHFEEPYVDGDFEKPYDPDDYLDYGYDEEEDYDE